MEFFSNGVFNLIELAFFNMLTANHIDSFCDIRQRRGIKGSKYAYVNSRRLHEKLNVLA